MSLEHSSPPHFRIHTLRKPPRKSVISDPTISPSKKSATSAYEKYSQLTLGDYKSKRLFWKSILPNISQ